MSVNGSNSWRAAFVIGGALYLAGSSQHPRGTMVHMLAQPAWVPAHATVTVALLILTAGLILLRRSSTSSPALQKWLPFAIVATALEAIEMGVHTMAYVDSHALAAGQSTPVFTTHMWLATLIYPLFAIAMLGLILAGQRERSLGSPWISWIGIVGALAHGVVMLLILRVPQAPILFPIAAILLSLWFVLAGFWRVRRPGLPHARTLEHASR